MKRTTFFLLCLLIAISLLTGCGAPSATPTPTLSPSSSALQPQSTLTSSAPRLLKVMTHDSFDMSEALLQVFQDKYNAKVQIIKGGDAGSSLNKIILSKESPPADVLYGVDNTFLGRALEEGIFEPYPSPLLDTIPTVFQLDPKARAIPVDYGDVCLNYDSEYFTKNGLTVPQSLDDLAKPQYKGMLVVENPASSSPGLAFLLATIGHFGEDAYLDYWKRLAANDLKVVNDWETAYYTEFSRYGGTRPLVVSYGSSPAYEIIGADQPTDEPLTAAIVSPETCFRQIEFVGVLKGTQVPDLAQAWVDFMLSQPFQEDVPVKLYMSPVNPQAKLDSTFQKYLAVAEQPANVTPRDIAEKRETWIKTWTETILR